MYYIKTKYRILYSVYSGPFLICLNMMFNSTASMVVNRIRKIKNVRATLPDGISEIDALTGNISWMVHG